MRRLALLLTLLAASALATAEKPIRKEILVPAPVKEVWASWTSDRGIRSWLAADSKIELRPNGAYEVYFASGGTIGERGSEDCKVLSYLPERMLSFSWNAPPSMPAIRKQRTFVVVEFVPQGKKTKVVLTNDGYGDTPEWRAARAYFDQAWARVLESNRSRFVKGVSSWAVTPPKPAPKKLHFAIFLRPARENFISTMTPAEQGAIGRHFARLKKLTDEGVVILGGPTENDPPIGLVIVEATSLEEARKVMDEDPCIKEGVFKGEIFPFSLALLRGRS